MAQPDFSRMTDAQLDSFLAANSGSQPQAPIQQNPLPNIPGSDASPYAHLSDAQLNAILANENPKMGTLEDVGRSAVSGVQRGIGGLYGGLGDVPALANAVETKFAPDLWEKTGLFSPEQMSIMRERSHIVGDTMERSLRLNPFFSGPGTAAINNARQKVTGPDHVPQTTPGKYARTIAEFAPGAMLGPGGAVTKSAMAVGGGGLSELGGQLTQGTPMEGPVRLAGGVLGAGVPGAIGGALATGPQRLMAEAMRGAAPEATPQAVQLMRGAEGMGIRLTPAEAIQQVTGNATGLGRMQRVIEGTKRGQEQLAPFFAQRPEQVRTAGMRFADAIAPPTESPSMIGPRAQTAAQGGIDTVRQGINEQAKPHYDALAGQTLPPEQFTGLQADPSFARALAELRGNPELNGPIAHLPDNDLSVVNEVVKQLDTDATAARQTVQNPAGNNRLAGLRGDARGTADALAGAVSDDWRQARDIVAQGHADYLDPLQAGPTGKIAKTADVAAQTGALYPKNPLEGASSETRAALGMMRVGEGVQSQRSGFPVATPGVGADLTRQHLVNELNSASRDLAQGPNQYVGSKYANAIAGQPEQAATLRSGVETVGGDPQRLDLMLEAMRATGKRQPAGSMTAFNQKDLEGLGATIPSSAFRPTDPTTWLKGLSDGVSAIQYRHNVDRLAQVLQMPADELERFMAGVQQARPRGSIIPAATAGRN